jgi:hypothetical protein
MIRLPYHPWRGRHCPVVEVTLSHDNKRARTLAYVDTGATYSVFHSDFCEALGLELKKGKRIGITVGDGGIIPVYVHRVKVIIEHLEIRCGIGFSDRLGIGINIIGREELLDEYMVCFDGKRREIVWHA